MPSPKQIRDRRVGRRAHEQARAALSEPRLDIEAVATLLNGCADETLWAYVAQSLEGERHRLPADWRDVDRAVWGWVPGADCDVCGPTWVKPRNCGGCDGAEWAVRPLWVKRTPVTVWEWDAVMTLDRRQDALPGNRPVTNVTHDEAVVYCDEMEARRAEDLLLSSWANPRAPMVEIVTDGNGHQSYAGLMDRYRLPTAAEWRHVAGEVPRCDSCGGNTASEDAAHVGGHDHCYDCDGTGLDLAWLDAHAWTARNSGGQVQPVGTREAGRLGLLDVWGNAMEIIDTRELGQHSAGGGSAIHVDLNFAFGDARLIAVPEPWLGFRPVRTAP